jgi:metal-responsive CopG/Arc/MetJ family transcriptional regulator
MKIRISATVDPKTNKKIEEFLKKSNYRNKSHLIEEAVTKFVEEKNE